MEVILDIAKKYHSFGLSVIPIGEDKRPFAYGKDYSWKKHQEKLIDPSSNFYDAKGIGLVAGLVSGNLEVIDIDLKYDLTGKLFDEYKSMINENDKDILKKLVVQKTVNNGYHFIYRCEVIEGNQSFAKRYTTDEEKEKNPKEKVKVLIETRGNGGYIACYPTIGYEIIYGSLDNIKTITKEERDILIYCAKSFNQVIEEKKERKEVAQIITDNKSPFEAWNESADVVGFLVSEGWKFVRERGDRTYLLRPSGEKLWSAEYHSQKRLFYVFSSSTEFEQEKAYNPSQVLTIVKFNGDYSASAIWLLKNGYGESNKKPLEQTKIKKEIVLNDLLSNVNDEREWINLAIQDKIPKGLTIGSEHFDNHFRFKPQTMVGVFGVDNVGKTTFQQFLAVCYAKKHGLKWLFLCKENKPQSIRQKIMELYHGKPLKYQTKEQIEEASKFAYTHFDIVNDLYSINIENIFEVLDKLFENKQYDAVFIDPYNAIQYDQTPNKNYAFLDSLRMYQTKVKTSFYISMHISTEKARNYVYSDKETIFDFQNREVSVRGQFKIPRKNFVEGGQPIANKLDDIIIVHRISKLIELKNYTLISIDKVKEEQTGGMVSFEEPIMFYKEKDFDCFIDKNRVNPLVSQRIDEVINKQSQLTPNNNFDINGDEIDELYQQKDESPF